MFASPQRMLIAHHTIVMLALGTIAFLLNKLNAIQTIIFFIAGVIIDIDHILAYWYYERDFTLRYKKIKAWCFKVGYRMEHFFVFHNLWFLIAVFLLLEGKIYRNTVIIGLLIHYILDIIYDAYWYFILKQNVRPYRRWIAPVLVLKKLRAVKYF